MKRKATGRAAEGGSETPVMAFRFPADLVARLKDHQARLEAQVPPGFTVTLADAVRSLLTEALDAAERRRK